MPIDSEQCYTKPAFSAFDTMRWLMSSFALCVGCIAFEWTLHGVLLSERYAQQPELWRSSLHGLFPFTMALPLAASLIVSSAYRNYYKRMKIGPVGSTNCPYRKSIKFGVWVGLFIGIMRAQLYLVMPIPGDIILIWLIACMIKGIAASIILCAVFQNMKPKSIQPEAV